MKESVLFAWICTLFFMSVPAISDAQQDYTVIMTERGPHVCVGTWLPPREAGLAGECQGQVMSFQQFSAISARQTADTLNQLVPTLSAIDQKMAVNNEQISRLIEVTAGMQTAIERQTAQTSDFLNETIASKFRSFPEELLADEKVRNELERLKKEILEEVERRYPRQKPPTKK